MSELKNLKVDAETHKALSARAKRMGMKIQKLAEGLIAAGLRLPDRKILEEITQLEEADTTKDNQPEQAGSPDSGKEASKRRNAR